MHVRQSSGLLSDPQWCCKLRGRAAQNEEGKLDFQVEVIHAQRQPTIRRQTADEVHLVLRESHLERDCRTDMLLNPNIQSVDLADRTRDGLRHRVEGATGLTRWWALEGNDWQCELREPNHPDSHGARLELRRALELKWLESSKPRAW